jgi:hypothetical protein
LEALSATSDVTFFAVSEAAPAMSEALFATSEVIFFAVSTTPLSDVLDLPFTSM